MSDRIQTTRKHIGMFTVPRAKNREDRMERENEQ